MSEEGAARRRPGGLGRGLSSLLGEVASEAPVGGGGARSGIQTLPITSIDPNPDQPRRHFDDDALDDLAQSIRSRGLIQPILVRPLGDRYQIVAGERRWRAAQRAQLHEVPIIVRELDDAATLEVAIVENIQRQDLNAIEEAEGYRRLIDEFGHTQDALGKLVHKSRSHVANLLRLLDLPDAVRRQVVNGTLSMGHARALLTSSDPEGLAEEVIRRGLSVRETEALAQRSKGTKGARQPSEPNADIAALERQLGDMLGVSVRIAHRAGGGSVSLGYTSLEQLDMICQRLSGERI